ncbi:MAG: hypothetical protein JXA66_05345, partial [Oligoflexia bacterium]|nr:hypothetical protein [Oligoflexia bacterium]
MKNGVIIMEMKKILYPLLILTVNTVGAYTSTDYKPVIKIEAELMPVEKTPVYSYIAGTVGKIFIKTGDFLKKGVKIATVISRDKSETVITAPFSGICDNIHVNLNDNIEAETPVTTIADYKTIRIPVQPENESLALINQSVSCVFFYGGKTRQCSLKNINDSFLVYIDNEDYVIKPGTDKIS